MRHRLPHFFATVCLVYLAVVVQAAPLVPIEIRPEMDFVPVWQGLRIIGPTDQELAPQQAAELTVGENGSGIDSPERILGRGTLPYWAAFSLYNPDTHAQFRLLTFEATTQSDIRLFERDVTGAWRQIRSLADAATKRFGGGTEHPVWALQLSPLQTSELLLRVEGPAVVRFPVFAYTPASFAEGDRKTHVLMGITLGICLLICVYIGSLRRYLDDASVLLFVCMLLADMVAALWLSGFLSELFPALPESTLSVLGFSAYAALFGCGSLHARIYLNVAAWAPRADRLLQTLGWLSLALIPWFPMAFPVAARILIVWAGTTVALVIVAISVLATRKKIPLSGFIVAAWLAYFFISEAFLVARITDNPRLWTSTTYALLQATVIAILFGLAMSQRLMWQRDLLVAGRQEALMQNETGAALMRERSLFFAATAHDLRQPLVGVSLFAYLLKSSSTPAEREMYAQKLDGALKEIDGLLIGIQQLAAVNESSHKPILETIKLDDLLASIIEEYRGRSEHKRITIRYVPSRLSIKTHVPYFQRIVRNILANAIRYTDQGNRILVGCRRGGRLRLIIADSGHGMTEEQTHQAFNAFQRFDSDASIPDGFGLGLFSTKSLARALGIEVALLSHKGRGTEFSIYLPPLEQEHMQ